MKLVSNCVQLHPPQRIDEVSHMRAKLVETSKLLRRSGRFLPESGRLADSKLLRRKRNRDSAEPHCSIRSTVHYDAFTDELSSVWLRPMCSFFPHSFPRRTDLDIHYRHVQCTMDATLGSAPVSTGFELEQYVRQWEQTTWHWSLAEYSSGVLGCRLVHFINLLETQVRELHKSIVCFNGRAACA